MTLKKIGKIDIEYFIVKVGSKNNFKLFKLKEYNTKMGRARCFQRGVFPFYPRTPKRAYHIRIA